MQPMIDWAESPLCAMLVRWTLVLSLAWLAHGLLRSRDARWRLILWRGVFCFGILLPLVALIHFPQYEIPVAAIRQNAPVVIVDKPTAISVAPEKPSAPTPSLLKTIDTPETHVVSALAPVAPSKFSWGSVFATLWALGSLILGFRLVRTMGQLKRIQQRAAAADPDMLSLSKAIQEHYCIKRYVPILISAETETPFIYGVFNPVVLLPEKLTRQLSLTELTALLQHEFAHQAHRDLFWCVGWRWMQAAFWFHPLIWLIPTVHNLACEEEADRAAADHIGSQTAYTEILAGLTLHILKVPAVETQLTANGAAEITRRLRRLGCHLRSWKRRHAAAAVAMVASIIALSTGCKITSANLAPHATAADTNKVEVLVLDQENKPLSGAQVILWKHGMTNSAVKVCGNTPIVTDLNGRVLVLTPPIEREFSPAVATNDEQRMGMGRKPHYLLRVSLPAHCSVAQEVFGNEHSLTYRLAKSNVEIRGHHAENRSKIELDSMIVFDTIGNLEFVEGAPGGSTFGHLRPGGHYIQVAGTNRNGSLFFSECTEIVTEPDKIAKFDLPMREGIQLKGRLNDQVPRPIKHGMVLVSVFSEKSPDYGRFPSITQRSSIAADGTFTFSNLPPGDAEIIAVGDGYMSLGEPNTGRNFYERKYRQVRPVALKRPVTDVVIDTKSSEPLDIYVHRKDGTPLPGIFIFEDKQYYCEICLRNWQSNLLFRFADWQSRNIQNALNYQNDTVEVETDQNGHAIITNVPPNLGALRYRTTHNSDSYFFLDLAHSKLIGNTLDWTVEK